MKKNVIWLIVLAALVTWLLFQKRNKPSGLESGAGPSPGTPLLSFDINQVSRMEMASSGATSTIRKVEGAWKAIELQDYPVDYEKLTRHLRQVAELRVGQVLRGGEKTLSEFGLDPAAEDKPPVGMRFFNATGTLLGTLWIGQPRRPGSDSANAMRPEGWYVRPNDGPVILVEDFLGDFPQMARDWINDTLLRIPAYSVQEVAVTASNSAYILKRQDEKTFALAEPDHGKDVNQAKAQQVAGALSFLSFSSAIRRGEEIAEAGFDSPEQFRAVCDDGMIYTLLLGARPDENTRYIRLTADFKPPLPPDAAEEGAAPPDTTPEQQAAHQEKIQALQKQTSELNSLFGAWTYVVPRYMADSMLMPLKDLVSAPGAEAPPAASN